MESDAVSIGKHMSTFRTTVKEFSRSSNSRGPVKVNVTFLSETAVIVLILEMA